MLIFGLALALVVGLVMGLLGAGGFTLIPIFVYLLHFEAKEAIAMSLAVVGTTSLVGAVRHGQSGNVNLKVALIFGPVAMVGTYLGARLSVFFSGEAQLTLFGTVVLTSAFLMLRDRDPKPHEMQHPRLVHEVVVIVALAVGMLTGLVGVGGGFMIVPVLMLVFGLPAKQAVGTSLSVITMTASAGFLGYLGHTDVAWGFMAGFTAIAIVGIWLGANLVHLLSSHTIKRVFGVFLLLMGAWILYQNRSVFGLSP